jgi:hypothetical protein
MEIAGRSEDDDAPREFPCSTLPDCDTGVLTHSGSGSLDPVAVAESLRAVLKRDDAPPVLLRVLDVADAVGRVLERSQRVRSPIAIASDATALSAACGEPGEALSSAWDAPTAPAWRDVLGTSTIPSSDPHETFFSQLAPWQ